MAALDVDIVLKRGRAINSNHFWLKLMVFWLNRSHSLFPSIGALTSFGLKGNLMSFFLNLLHMLAAYFWCKVANSDSNLPFGKVTPPCVVNSKFCKHSFALKFL